MRYVNLPLDIFNLPKSKSCSCCMTLGVRFTEFRMRGGGACSVIKSTESSSPMNEILCGAMSSIAGDFIGMRLSR